MNRPIPLCLGKMDWKFADGDTMMYCYNLGDGLVFQRFSSTGFLSRDAMYSADYAVARCLSVSPSACPSVRLSVTRRYCVETAKRITKRFHYR